ncbi:putative aldehyde oxidase Art an 7 [Rhododendron vialii]|uniref:putative aldehyde oxidase Art an 7 n=1 Tax=Rhododendron vialii TaxID=182163 RepID=UPI00265E1709|nr:putative aldehyde oxidase Art an 7 [Rhododendron vialii]
MAISLKSLFFLSLLFVSGFALPNFQTNYLGGWKIHNPNAGVEAMHIQLLPTNKAILFDATNLGPSNIQLQPPGNCRPIPDRPGQVDCWAHAVEYDVETAEVRPLKILSNAWCSAGGLTIDGSLMSVGGNEEGNRSVRILNPCQGCDFEEHMNALAGARWYSSQEKLEDGSFIIFGGRREFTYEYLPINSLTFTPRRLNLPFLGPSFDGVGTTDIQENNLYPFVHLLPDGTIFLFANRRSIIIDTKTDTVVRELPRIPGGSRNQPATGMSALLPLKISNDGAPVQAEVIVCGGAKPDAADAVAANKGLWPALLDCGRISPMNPDANWAMENMPTRRIMGDFLLLPTAQALILNGAMEGISGWYNARNPNYTPLLYSPDLPLMHRFKSLAPTDIARMYHSSSAVLADGTVLVAGSNSNRKYVYSKKESEFPTELRVEKFSPPYLDPLLDTHRPTIAEGTSDKILSYGGQFSVEIHLEDAAGAEDLKLTLLHPPFTTHGYSQSQRMLVLEPVSYVNGVITAVAPASGKLAPPGYYILYVVHRGVPSRGMWVQIHE